MECWAAALPSLQYSLPAGIKNFEHVLHPASLSPEMRWNFKVMAAVLALLWLPLSSHCTWEHLPGLELFSCHTEAEPAPHQDDDCQSDGCAAVESGSYKIEEQPFTIPAQLLVPCIVQLLPSVVTPSLHDGAAPASPPPELSCNWQFTFRAAAPPRAPSFVS